jgi:peptidoglycan/LPS O-acetylase OafA/YrhL
MTGHKVLSKFGRVTSSGRFISEIDGLRFIAISSVVLYHVNSNPVVSSGGTPHGEIERAIFTNVVSQGFHGVQLFFVISGFILGYPFAAHYLQGKPRVRLQQYFLRRVTRLEPPYIICMLGLFALWIAFKGWNFAATLPHLLASMGYVHNIIYGEASTINNVAWSLEIEIQFYLLVPFLTLVFALRNTLVRRLTILLMCLPGVLTHWVFGDLASRWTLSVFCHVQFFLVGFLLVDTYIVEWDEQPTTSFKWDVISLLGWPALFIVWALTDNMVDVYQPSLLALLQAILFPGLTYVLYCAVFRGRITRKIFTFPIITITGGMCYTIYLLHNNLIGMLMRVIGPRLQFSDYLLSYSLQVLIVSPLLLLPCAAYFLMVERPCMRKDWPSRLWGKVRPVFSFLPPRR